MSNNASDFLGITPPDSVISQPSEPEQTPPLINQLLKRRYGDAYLVSFTVDGFGKIIKGIAIVLFVLIFIVGLVLATQQRDSSGGFILLGPILGLLVSIPVYILGILVSMQAQIHLAALDTAVNSSRHLTDDDVAIILRKGVSK